MKTRKSFIFHIPLLVIIFAVSFSTLFAQRQAQIVDIHNFGASKSFGSRHSSSQSVWDHIEHDCSYNFQKTIVDAFNEMAKESQADFRSMIDAGSPFTCVSFEPLEKPFLKPAYMGRDELKGTLSCLTGVLTFDAIAFVQDIDYFADFIKFYTFLKEQSKSEYQYYGKTYSFSIIDSKEKLKSVMNNPQELGVILTISGGHTLGHSLYIDNYLTEDIEYVNLVMNNIRRLKGAIPLYENTDEYMAHPVLFISPASYFENGFCGSAQSWSDEQVEHFSRQTHINKGFSKLGSTILHQLLSKDAGRRILVDVSQMSLLSRQQYYDFVIESRKNGDNIPIVASHVGISGMSWDDSFYANPDRKQKKIKTYLNHNSVNLSREDILAIYESEGIIGITMNQSLMCGDLVKDEIKDIIPGSSQFRKAYLKSILANVFTVVKSIDNRFAWDIIALGSDFDNMMSPVPMYSNTEEMPDLMEDIVDFLNNPEDIYDVFSEHEVKRLMFGISPDALVSKVFSTNAIRFVERNLPEYTFAKSNQD
ncbi:MAG: membrane dipeptidase [Bacteroidota bacterium]